ncbi:MAG: plastocyanin/azurin family copper-binding protein [Solirubrobacteraceae bacterium]
MRHPTADQARPWRISIIPLLALVGIFALAGCGSSKSSSSSESTPATTPPATTTATTESTGPIPASGALSLEANPEGQLKYNTTSLTAKAGAVSIAFKNSSPIGHNVTVESSSGASEGATPTFTGGSKTLKLNLKPGTYKFYCSVPGHRMAGMEGTLTVK